MQRPDRPTTLTFAAIALALVIAGGAVLCLGPAFDFAPLVGLLGFAMVFTVLSVLLAPMLHRAGTGWRAGRY